MQTQDIFDKLKKEFADAILELIGEAPSEPFIQIEPIKIVDVCQFLRDDDEFDFDYLVDLTGYDYKDSLGVIYHLYSMKLKHRLVLKVTLSMDNPKVPTIENIWRAADWHEREAYDLFGVEFEGHHNLIRILNPYDWEGFPLRKDYKEPEEYHGMKVPY